MSEIKESIERIASGTIQKLVISKPASKQELYRRIVVEAKWKNPGKIIADCPADEKKQPPDYYQFSSYTDKQVFHENVDHVDFLDRCVAVIDGHYRQVNLWTVREEHSILISKKGDCHHTVRRLVGDKVDYEAGAKSGPESAGLYSSAPVHNRKKNYLLEEGRVVAPLVDMGIYTKEGKVVRSMYDKYKQINRFLEIIDDEVRESKQETLHIIDFGCGKSYLTFVVYYYLTELLHRDVEMIGLDLKEDVIAKCNASARKYGYEKLHFEVGDIAGYETPFNVDMVLTLHACDTATDYALYHAIQWKAKMIFSVPCCQHELNKQIESKDLSLLTRYGIVKERFCALMTDSIRANLLEYSGYKTQILEFIDLEHTPKNLLIRAVRRPLTPKSIKDRAMHEVETCMEQFQVEPILYRLLQQSDSNPQDS